MLTLHKYASLAVSMTQTRFPLRYLLMPAAASQQLNTRHAWPSNVYEVHQLLSAIFGILLVLTYLLTYLLTWMETRSTTTSTGSKTHTHARTHARTHTHTAAIEHHHIRSGQIMPNNKQ